MMETTIQQTQPTQHTAIVIQQQPVVVATNPKLLGNVQGIRDWSAGL